MEDRWCNIVVIMSVTKMTRDLARNMEAEHENTLSARARYFAKNKATIV